MKTKSHRGGGSGTGSLPRATGRYAGSARAVVVVSVPLRRRRRGWCSTWP